MNPAEEAEKEKTVSSLDTRVSGGNFTFLIDLSSPILRADPAFTNSPDESNFRRTKRQMAISRVSIATFSSPLPPPRLRFCRPSRERERVKAK